MTRAIDLNEKDTYQLVWLSHEGGDTFWTDWSSDVDYQGNTYFSRPTMEVELPKNSGGMEEDRCVIAMQLEDGILTSLTDGDAFAPVEVTIYERTRPAESSASSTTATTFLGELTGATRNVNGEPNKVRLIAQTDKQFMEVAMGQQCNHLCSNSLGDARCLVDMSLGVNTYFGLVTSMSDRAIEISIGGTLTSASDRYFSRGYVQYQGLRIMIRSWVSGSATTFVFVRRPPASWLGQTVLVFAGCDKSVETCRERYDNEEHFNGIGYAIPAYIPWIEDASGV